MQILEISARGNLHLSGMRLEVLCDERQSCLPGLLRFRGQQGSEVS
jgi:hypothetical protein